ncbi:hypothetical protein BC833DRAFT_635636, partial [Globomyces pollinis-pini]
ILEKYHDEIGHRGILSTITFIRERYFWENLNQTVTEYVNPCMVCQRRSRVKQVEPLKPILGLVLHQKWFVDIQKLPKSKGYIGIIEAREGLTGFLEARIIRRKHSTFG